MTEILNKNKVGRLITKGGHYEVREYGKDKVIKIPLSRAVRYIVPLQAKENYLLLKHYIRDYLPETEFISDKKYNQPLVVQKRIRGRALGDIGWEEIKKSNVLRKNLLRLIKGIVELEEETGKIAEMFGKGRLWWRAHPENTSNIIIDKKGKPFLVDVFLLDPNLKEIKISLWRRMRRKWIFWLLKRSLRNMEKELESLSG